MDKSRLLNKIGQLELYIHELEEIIPPTDEKYLHSIRDKRAVERILQISIECTIDICALLIKALSLGPPTDEDNLLDLLHNKLKIIPIIKEMKRFRNILVHKYGEINDLLVYKYALERRIDFFQFIDQVRNLISTIK